MPSYKAEVQYLKEVIKAYQLAIANAEYVTEGVVTDKKEDERIGEAFAEMKQIIAYKVWSSTIQHNRTRGEFDVNNTFPDVFTDADLGKK